MKSILGIVLAASSGLVLAQSGGIGALKFEPNPVQVGKEVKITISAEGEAPAYCGMVVHFDDGSESRNVKIDGKENKFPVSFGKTYAKPGTYSIKAEGKKITTHFPCVGKAEAKLVVEGVPAPAKPAAPAKAAGPNCPEGWKMMGKPGKAGNFGCKAGKGAMMPKEPMTCAAGLEPYTNEKAKQLGCRAPKKK
ncbi:MAG: hypothetical protein WC681_23165 [Sterolibacterium sp.]|jgi:hypothetical protein